LGARPVGLVFGDERRCIVGAGICRIVLDHLLGHPSREVPVSGLPRRCSDRLEGEQRLDPVMVERHGYEYARRKGLVSMIGGKRKTEIRNATPPEFRDLLIRIASTASPAPVRRT